MTIVDHMHIPFLSLKCFWLLPFIPTFKFCLFLSFLRKLRSRACSRKLEAVMDWTDLTLTTASWPEEPVQPTDLYVERRL